MSKSEKKVCFYGILFAAVSIAFALLYFLNVSEAFTVYFTVNYVVYFVGLAMLFVGAYCKEKQYKKTGVFCNLIGLALIGLAIALLVYGCNTGHVSLW